MKEEIKKQIEIHLEKHPAAARFLHSYGTLCHAVDDLIDRDNPAITDYKALALDCFNLSIDIFSSGFYHANLSWLYPLAKQIHRVFSASVAWEHSKEEWKARHADVLRCCGNEMITGVLEHVCHLPYAELRRIDMLIREDSWARHHDTEGQPI